MKKEKAWELLTNNYVAVVGMSTDNDLKRMKDIVHAVKEYIPALVNDVTKKPKIDGRVMHFEKGRAIDYDDFDLAYVDKNDDHIIYLRGDRYLCCFYVFEKIEKSK